MIRKYMVIALLAMAYASSSFAATWYVNGQSGRDWYAGGVMMPKRTIQAAIDAAANPSLTTAPTKVGLIYTLHEGATLEGMTSGDSKIGDGKPWVPTMSIRGGKSGFYSIGVSK